MSPDTHSETTEQAAHPGTHDHFRHRMHSHYFSSLARYSATILTGILVALSFLLLAGLRQPKFIFVLFMYASIVTNALTLIVYTAGNYLKLRAAAEPTKDHPDSDSRKSDKLVSSVELAQQIIFVLAVIAVAGFAYEIATMFFAAAPTAAPAQG